MSGPTRDDAAAEERGTEQVETAPQASHPNLFDDASGHDHGPLVGEEPPEDRGAMWVIRRGIRTSPELRRGLLFTSLLALVGAVGKLAIPILIQQVMDRAIIGVDEFEGEIVAAACAATIVLILLLAASVFRVATFDIFLRYVFGNFFFSPFFILYIIPCRQRI